MWPCLHSANLSCLLAADPILEHLPSPMSLHAKLSAGLYTSLRLPRRTMASQTPRVPHAADRSALWDGFGGSGIREGPDLAMDAWLVVAGCGTGSGSLHEPGEVPSILCSCQQSMDVEWCVTGTATQHCDPKGHFHLGYPWETIRQHSSEAVTLVGS